MTWTNAELVTILRWQREELLAEADNAHRYHGGEGSQWYCGIAEGLDRAATLLAGNA